MAWLLLDKALGRVSSVWNPSMVAAIGLADMVATALVVGLVLGAVATTRGARSSRAR